MKQEWRRRKRETEGGTYEGMEDYLQADIERHRNMQAEGESDRQKKIAAGRRRKRQAGEIAAEGDSDRQKER